MAVASAETAVSAEHMHSNTSPFQNEEQLKQPFTGAAPIGWRLGGSGSRFLPGEVIYAADWAFGDEWAPKRFCHSRGPSW